MVAMERIAECRAERSRVIDAPDAITPEGCEGNIEFQAVSFGYHVGESTLNHISFVIKPGQTIALVGRTGSGKSTIANLIPRFYDPDSGRILLDGHDLKTLSLPYLRRQVALVTQEPLLFQATVWENIAYGLSGAGREDAMAAARAAGVDDVIERLPAGFDSLVSERGLTLSGGQRQCVAIARAMLCEAPVVILDEPSSSLDAATERRLILALRRLSAA